MIEKSNSTSLVLATIAILGQPPNAEASAAANSRLMRSSNVHCKFIKSDSYRLNDAIFNYHENTILFLSLSVTVIY